MKPRLLKNVWLRLVSALLVLSGLFFSFQNCAPQFKALSSSSESIPNEMMPPGVRWQDSFLLKQDYLGKLKSLNIPDQPKYYLDRETFPKRKTLDGDAALSLADVDGKARSVLDGNRTWYAQVSRATIIADPPLTPNPSVTPSATSTPEPDRSPMSSAWNTFAGFRMQPRQCAPTAPKFPFKEALNKFSGMLSNSYYHEKHRDYVYHAKNQDWSAGTCIPFPRALSLAEQNIIKAEAIASEKNQSALIPVIMKRNFGTSISCTSGHNLNPELVQPPEDQDMICCKLEFCGNPDPRTVEPGPGEIITPAPPVVINPPSNPPGENPPGGNPPDNPPTDPPPGGGDDGGGGGGGGSYISGLPYFDGNVSYMIMGGPGPGNKLCPDDPNDDPDCGETCPGSYAWDMCKAGDNEAAKSRIAEQERYNSFKKLVPIGCSSSFCAAYQQMTEMHQAITQEITNEYEAKRITLRQGIRSMMMDANEFADGITKATSMRTLSYGTTLVIGSVAASLVLPGGFSKYKNGVQMAWRAGASGWSRIYNVAKYGGAVEGHIIKHGAVESFVKQLSYEGIKTKIELFKAGSEMIHHGFSPGKALLSTLSFFPVIGAPIIAFENSESFIHELNEVIDMLSENIDQCHEAANHYLEMLREARKIRDEAYAELDKAFREAEAELNKRQDKCMEAAK